VRVPASTYRLQFNREFGFEDARAIVPYLEALGVGDVYASPLLAARPGSEHGYDITDPTRLNRELGSPRSFRQLVSALRSRRIGFLLDIVPNHMATDSANPWWMDVLENGRGSRFATFFDIDWEAPGLDGRVLVPVLGGPYGEVLERGELRLVLESEGLRIAYFDHRAPLDVATYGDVLRDALGRLPTREGRPLGRLLLEVERLPPPLAAAAAIEARARVSPSVKRRLWRLRERDPATRRALDAAIRRWGGCPRGVETLTRLDSLIGRQAYLLAYWRAAPEEIDYRRFFDIADLVSLRVDDQAVFDTTHVLPLRLLRDGSATGLRIDHVDGLRDPLDYLRRLQQRAGGDAFVVVEKILARDERLPEDWPVAGTTGYDAMHELNDVLIDARGAARLRELAARFTGDGRSFEEVVAESKRTVMETLFGAELSRLSRWLQRLARLDMRARDLTLSELRQAVTDVTAALPVYRTYVRAAPVGRQDRERIERAVRDAERRTGSEGGAYDFLRRVLLLEPAPGGAEDQTTDRLGFVLRWQQLTGPAMAKGLEDTALYRDVTLVSRGDVGGEPGGVPFDVTAFHRRARARLRRWPNGLVATSTHDAKRSEDVRARIDVLSEIPDEWGAAVERWHRWHEGLRRDVDGVSAPDATTELLLYQTLAGTWPADGQPGPAFIRRIRDYLRKAGREAKVHTSWIDPNEGFERAVDAFVRGVLAGSNRSWRRDFARVHETVALHGAVNALAQTLLKIAGPGVPDIYQGTETWSLRLVDPDNRVAVDFGALTERLADLDHAPVASLLDAWPDGRVKLLVTSRALRCRRRQAELFAHGSYAPLHASGRMNEHVVAFARRAGDAWAVAVAPRLTVGLGRGRWPVGEVWGRSVLRLPDGAPERWSNVLTDEALSVSGGGLPLARALATLPVALLTAAAGEPG
jgi:(1->4)-alpha-D-glucan 1-alpha-D-glucosylmutase